MGLQGFDHDGARDIARDMASEPVSDGEQRSPHVQGVLVTSAHQSDMGSAGGLNTEHRHHDSPAGSRWSDPAVSSGQGSCADWSRCRTWIVSTRSLATTYSVTSIGLPSRPD